MKDTKVFLTHIVQSIEKIERFTKDLTKRKFLKHELVQSGTLRELEVMGEATKNLPKTFTQKHETIPWLKMAQTRDKLIHNYFGVDFEIIWEVVKKELPKVKKEIKKIYFK